MAPIAAKDLPKPAGALNPRFRVKGFASRPPTTRSTPHPKPLGLLRLPWPWFSSFPFDLSWRIGRLELVAGPQPAAGAKPGGMFSRAPGPHRSLLATDSFTNVSPAVGKRRWHPGSSREERDGLFSPTTSASAGLMAALEAGPSALALAGSAGQPSGTPAASTAFLRPAAITARSKQGAGGHCPGLGGGHQPASGAPPCSAPRPAPARARRGSYGPTTCRR